MTTNDEIDLRRKFDAFVQLARKVRPTERKYVAWSEQERELKNAAASLTLCIDAIAGMWDNSREEA